MTWKARNEQKPERNLSTPRSFDIDVFQTLGVLLESRLGLEHHVVLIELSVDRRDLTLSQASYSVLSIICAVMPRRAAVSRSITNPACRPLFCWSLFTSSKPETVRNFASMRGPQTSRSWTLSLCNVYWYCALLARPPTRKSCTGCMYNVTAGMRASWREAVQ